VPERERLRVAKRRAAEAHKEVALPPDLVL
jgi:hypothetical protein